MKEMTNANDHALLKICRADDKSIKRKSIAYINISSISRVQVLLLCP